MLDNTPEDIKETRGRPRNPEWGKLIQDLTSKIQQAEKVDKSTGCLWITLDYSDLTRRQKYTDRLRHSTEFIEFKEDMHQYNIGVFKSRTELDKIAIAWSLKNEAKQAKQEN